MRFPEKLPLYRLLSLSAMGDWKMIELRENVNAGKSTKIASGEDSSPVNL